MFDTIRILLDDMFRSREPKPQIRKELSRNEEEALIEKLLQPISIDRPDVKKRLEEKGFIRNHHLCEKTADELLLCLRPMDVVLAQQYLYLLNLQTGMYLSEEIRAKLLE